MIRNHTTYAAALAEANKRARETGVEVAIRELDDGTYRLQQRFELVTEGKLAAIAKPK